MLARAQPIGQAFPQQQQNSNHHHHPQQFYHHHPQQQQQQLQSEGNVGRSCPQLALILITLFLLLTAVILAVIALLNPSWQVVDIREFQAEHHHGLYTDCTRAERNPAASRRLEAFVEKSPLHCTYKFEQRALENVDAQIRDIESNAAAAEAEHHQFYGWQKAVLVFMGLSLVAALFSCTMGLCAPCTAGCAILHSIASFFSFLFAIVAASVFFFAAHRVDARFVVGLVGTYEQQVGEAFYCYVISCLLLMLVFILSLIGAYHALRSSTVHEQQTAAVLARREQMAPLATSGAGGHWLEGGGAVAGVYGKTTV